MDERESIVQTQTDVAWIKKTLEGYGGVLQEHSRVLAEIRELAAKTNGRVNTHEREIAEVWRTLEDVGRKAEEARISWAKVMGGATMGGVIATLVAQAAGWLKP